MPCDCSQPCAIAMEITASHMAFEVQHHGNSMRFPERVGAIPTSP